MGQLSNRLAGWHFVLDPGHGGIDPGTTVRAKDGEGKTFTIVEDEYVYDIALRVYVLLKLHGADVTLTLLSPNHLLRQNSPASSTFVHDRNEVFNSASWNKRDRPGAWPKGGQKYLDARVDVAKEAFRGVPAGPSGLPEFPRRQRARPGRSRVPLLLPEPPPHRHRVAQTWPASCCPPWAPGPG